MSDKLTTKQRKFINKVVKTGKIGDSAVSAGLNRTYGSQLMAQPKIQTALQKAIDEAGLSDSKIAKKLKQGLNAYKPPARDGGKKYPDFYVRQKYLDMLIKIKGGYAPEKHEIEHKQIVLHFTPETLKGLVDSKVLTEEEADVIEGEIINDSKTELDDDMGTEAEESSS